MWQRPLLACAALLLAGRRVGAHELTVSGFCDAKSFLDGLVFRSVGITVAGAPWFKAVGQEQYLYWDPDCASHGDGAARWIIDSDPPDPEAESDLDGDGLCKYHARINSRDRSRPPVVGIWTMECQGGWRSKVVFILDVATSTTTVTTRTRTTTSTQTHTTTTQTGTSSSTSTSSTTSSATTTVSSTSVTETTTTTPEPTTTETETETTADGVAEPPLAENQTSATEGPVMLPTHLILTGACPFKHFLNGLVYELQGEAADSAPYYKAVGVEEYLYHDADCDNRSSSARWVLDTDRPDPNRTADLDADGRCTYHARVPTAVVGARRPPHVATWYMYCGQEFSWRNVTVTLREVGKPVPALRCPDCPYPSETSTTTATSTHQVPMFLSEARRPHAGTFLALALPLLALVTR